MNTKKNLFKILSYIFIIIGILLITLGLIKFSLIKSNVSKENNDEWFEILSYNYSEKNKATILIISGFFMTVGMGTVFLLLSNKNKFLNDDSDDNEDLSNIKCCIDNKCIHCGAPIKSYDHERCEYCGYKI